DDSEPVAVTGADGAFAIRGAGAWFVITATAPGLGCATETWVGEQTVITLTMRPAPGTVLGTVLDPEGRPVRGARLLLGAAMTNRDGMPPRIVGRISGHDLWPSRFLRTDTDGSFRSEGLPPIRWPLWIGAPGFAPCFQEVQVRADAPTEVTVRLTAGATVQGRLVDETGAAASGVEVFAAPDLPAPHEWIGLGMKVFTQPPLWAHMATKTGADGSYRLRRVMVGKLMLRAWGATRRTAKTECELVDGKTFVWDGALAPEVNPTWQPF